MTWEWIATTLSIFIAVCVWAGFNFAILLDRRAAMREAGNSEKTIALNLAIYALFAVLLHMAVYLSVVSALPRCLAEYIPNALAFVTVWAHVIGFALMNHIAYIQDYFVALFTEEDSPSYLIFGISSLVWIGYFPLTYISLHIVNKVILSCCITEDRVIGQDLVEKDSSGYIHSESPYHLVKAHLEEFSVEAGGLALSYTLMRGVCGAITGTLPDVFQVVGTEKSYVQIGALTSFGVVCALIAAIMHALEKTCTGKHHGLEYSMTFLTFLTAFTFLQALRWSTYTNDPSTQHSLYDHISFGFLSSYLGLAFNLIWYQGCSHKLTNFMLEIAKIFAILAAFTWELSLDIMLEQANLLNMGSTFNHLLDSAFIFVLTIFLAPVFIIGVYPTTHICRKEKEEITHDSTEQGAVNDEEVAGDQITVREAIVQEIASCHDVGQGVATDNVASSDQVTIVSV